MLPFNIGLSFVTEHLFKEIGIPFLFHILFLKGLRYFLNSLKSFEETIRRLERSGFLFVGYSCHCYYARRESWFKVVDESLVLIFLHLILLYIKSTNVT